jgi:DNA end-binding protein Ku
MAGQLIESMTGPWKPSDYRDTYTDRVNDLIDAKRHDREVQPVNEAPPGTDVVDLTEALRASVEAAKHEPSGKRSGGRGKPKEAPARKKSAKRPARKRAA